MIQARSKLLTFAAFAGLCLSLPAQETTGGIQGTIKDPTGGVVPKASVELSGSNLIGSRKVQTDSSGTYRLTALPAGEYTMTVTASGFSVFKLPSIKVDVGRLPTIDV